MFGEFNIFDPWSKPEVHMRVEIEIILLLWQYSYTIVTLERSGIIELYTLSYLWYTAVGILATLFVGILVSFLTGMLSQSMNINCH